MAVKLATNTANAMLNAITTAIGANGRCKIYQGTVPTNVADTPASPTPIADIPLAATAFPGAAAGSMSLSGVPLTDAADATANATFFRITTSGGTAVLQGEVGIAASGKELILNTVALTSGVNVSITSGTITLAGS